jgi:Holliday junction DNA helicase RuvA
MIARLTGIIQLLKPNECIMDVSGVGYHLHIPFSTFEMLKPDSKATLQVYTLHREDQFRLYGFHSEAEREFFAQILTVSGIGPAMGLSILSGISVDRFIEAVHSGNTDRLTKIPGIGKAKAEKIIFEMKRKVKKLGTPVETPTEGSLIRNDAIDALMALGFDEKKSVSVIEAVQNDMGDASLEIIIKEALKRFSA